MSVALLLVRESIKVLLDLEPDDRGRGVGEILGQFLSVHGEETTRLLLELDSSDERECECGTSGGESCTAMR
jgi:hypothetical protein